MDRTKLIPRGLFRAFGKSRAREAFSGSAVRRFVRDCEGTMMVVTAIAVPVLIGFAGLGTEGGYMYLKHSQLQIATDAAALSGANAYLATSSTSVATIEARAVAAQMGYVDGVNGVSVTVHSPPTSGAKSGATSATEVSISISQKPMLISLFRHSNYTITARTVSQTGTTGNGCILALNTSVNSSIGLGGSTVVTLNNCNAYSNSSNASSVSAGGSSSMTAALISTAGGVATGSNITATTILTGAAPLADPYASVPNPSFSGCNFNNFSTSKTVTLSPGVYCGGMNFGAHAVATLQPGTYYMDSGSFNLNSQASVSGSGVTIVLTSSTGSNYAGMDVNAGATLSLTAPTSGTYSGIVVYGDRRMPQGSSFSAGGNGAQSLAGAIYLPKGIFYYGGSNVTSTACTQIIADQISFGGNSSLSANCTGYGTRAFGGSATAIVE